MRERKPSFNVIASVHVYVLLFAEYNRRSHTGHHTYIICSTAAPDVVEASLLVAFLQWKNGYLEEEPHARVPILAHFIFASHSSSLHIIYW